MSHYNIGVIIPSGTSNPEQEVIWLMEPFNEQDEDCKEPHWDWWRIGGRWDGVIKGAFREDANDGGFNFGGDHEQLENNMVPVKYLLQGADGQPITKQVMARLLGRDMWIPYAIVTPDGEWHENEDPEWKAKAIEIYSQYADYNIVSCDIHD